MQIRSPFNVTHKGISVIFIKTKGQPLKIQVSQESLWSLYSKHFGGFEGRSHAATGEIMQGRVSLTQGPGSTLSYKLKLMAERIDRPQG